MQCKIKWFVNIVNIEKDIMSEMTGSPIFKIIQICTWKAGLLHILKL